MWRFFSFLFIFSLCIFSCSNAVVQEDEIQGEVETLKNIIHGKEAQISWTGELEGDRLYYDVYGDSNISYEVALTPVVVNVAGGHEAVYPELLGFGSLDSRMLSDELRSFVNSFAEAVNKNIYQGPGDFFHNKYFFNYVFFRGDFIQDWEDFFGEDFPQNVPGDGEEDLSGGEGCVKELFSGWHLGKPVISDEILEQPVRFYCKGNNGSNIGCVDFVIYIRLNDKKIYQVSRGVFSR